MTKARSRREYLRIRDLGLCMLCKKSPSDGGVHCAACRAVVREKQRARRLQARVDRAQVNDGQPITSPVVRMCEHAKSFACHLHTERLCGSHARPIAIELADMLTRFPTATALIVRAVSSRLRRHLGWTSPKARAMAAKRYRKLRRAKLCVFCTKPTSGYVLCDTCRAKNNARLASAYHSNRAVDACTDCRGIPAAGKTRCEACSRRRREVPSRQWSYRREKERSGSCPRAGP